jgi:hypothetical protein
MLASIGKEASFFRKVVDFVVKWIEAIHALDVMAQKHAESVSVASDAKMYGIRITNSAMGKGALCAIPRGNQVEWKVRFDSGMSS